MNRFARHITALMLVLTLGLHWTVLQSVAWMGMLVNYSSTGSFEEALEKTFDGKHPCKLCLAVAAGERSERNQKQLLNSFGKSDWLFAGSSEFNFIRPESVAVVPPSDLPPLFFGESPPVPPPRLA